LFGENLFTKIKFSKMEINQLEENGVRREMLAQPVSVKTETFSASHAFKHLKKLAYITGLAGVVIFSNACMTSGYVTSEPVYTEYSRPPQPSNLHVWIGGDWGWNRSNRTYVQRTGHWQKPEQGRSYREGSWKTSEKGHSWTPGRWERNDR
jgi:hypothetical protein